MIFGTYEIGDGVLGTHNDSYAVTSNTSFSVLRPFRVVGFAVAALLSAFGGAFHDILYPAELCFLVICATATALIGNSLAHLVIVNRELKGLDLSVALWGTYRRLNCVRREIASSVAQVRRRDTS